MTDTDAPPTAAATTARRTTRRSRRWIGWLVVALLLIGGALVMLRIADSTSVLLRDGDDPESTGEYGTLALAEILRDQGVEVDVVRSRVEAAAAVDGDTTLVMSDPYTLTDDAVTSLLEPADHVVLLSASSRMLRMLDLGEDSAARTSDAVEASCDMPELAKIGTVHPDRLFVPAEGVTACYQDGGGSAALLIDDRNDRRTVMIDGSRLFGNGYLAQDGNAALGLALLGQRDRVVWYVPSFGDSDITADTEPSLGDLTPAWVTPAIVMLVLAGVGAALWRGRRFGPLVAETLPVTVRASETMHGRARLTARTADASHAADAIRDGTVRRLARRLGLHERATAPEVADAAADRLRVPRDRIHTQLTGTLPATDQELIETARSLAELEDAIDAVIRSERGA